MRLSLRGVLMLMRERMNWNGVLRYETRNGNEVVKASARKHKRINPFCFIFSAPMPGGGENLWSSGSGAGLREGLVRLFYIIRL